MKITNLVDVPYAQVPNAVLFDKKLSWRAKAIFAYIQAKPDDYDFSSKRMILESNDGLEATLGGLKELEEYGYLRRERTKEGKMEYILIMPIEEYYATSKPSRQKPKEGKTLRGKNPPITNKEYIQIKNNTKSIYGEFKKVLLSEEEHSKLIERIGEKNTTLLIAELDAYIASKGTRYKDHYATLLTWARRKLQDHQKTKSNIAF